ncbi:hypothetical protein HU200_043727 [Digitaria exilis]|uniref:Uncharacterized protein n=1 Tax=Digitaria exilis TaxID=1010633 RepID=A0A835EFV3_9POAL|nr:hypothetical protein HU200_043727 [Digitaria exilis]
MPIVDARSMGVKFAPGLRFPGEPILITVGEEEVFALDTCRFRMLSMNPLCPLHDLSWCDLPPPPAFESFEVTSWESGPRKGDENVRPGKENLFSKDPAESHVGATLVYLGGSEPAGFCLVECVSITEGKSVNMQLDEEGGNCGELDQLKMNVDEGGGAYGSIPECGELDELKKFVDEGDGASGSMQECGELDELKDDASGSMHYRYLYRLTTFSLSFDSNGDLTTGETCVVQCYKVPEGVSDAIYRADPVAFWL